jgi:CubicO group peptidase (beta-lactamase class C family)
MDLADQPRDLAAVAPEAVGLSREGLAHVDAFLEGLIADGELAGALTLVGRHGRIAHVHAMGMKDLATGEPVAADTIFRIYSMTKPVTAVAMMALHEEGRWRADEAIAVHLPEFADLRVLAGFDADGKPVLAAPDHAPTLGELMTHTAGFSYGFMPEPIDAMYRAADIWKQPSLDAFVGAVAALPLAYQPGTAWRYSVAMDIQGAIIERLSGQSLGDFMQARIFGPLGMADTGFFLPAEKAARLAGVYRRSKARGLVPPDVLPLGVNHTAPPAMASGGGGLVSTAHDYARFAQMLLDRGEFGGVRVLRPESVERMTRNQLPPRLMAGPFGIGAQQIRPGFGHGYNCAVHYDPHQAGIPVGQGTFQWDGAAGTWFWVDPANDLFFIGMIQRFSETGLPIQEETQRRLAAALLHTSASAEGPAR